MSSPILAKNAKPGMRLSLDPDGNGRIVAKVAVRFRSVIIHWTDGGSSEHGPKDTLHLITPPQEAA